MITGFIGFVIGALFAIVYATFALRYMKQKGHYASAMWLAEEKRWRVRGKFAKVAEEVTAIQQGRKPGAIKYVD